MVTASQGADRSNTIGKDLWSLNPLALLETISLHLFGNYFTSQSLDAVPWLPLVNTGREPFFFSTYYGLPVFALAVFGLVAGGCTVWGNFWAAIGGASLLFAFGIYTPVYPFLREHLPVLGSFRFPVRYLVVFSMAVAAGVAAGWDALRSRATSDVYSPSFWRARLDAVAFAFLIGTVSLGLAITFWYFPVLAASRASALGRALGAIDTTDLAPYMVRVLPRHAIVLTLVAFASGALLWLATGKRGVAAATAHTEYSHSF